MNITGTGSAAFSCKIRCSSYPSISGISKSDSTMSGFSAANSSTASAPDDAHTVRYFFARIFDAIRNIIASSSTISIVCISAHLQPFANLRANFRVVLHKIAVILLQQSNIPLFGGKFLPFGGVAEFERADNH